MRWTEQDLARLSDRAPRAPKRQACPSEHEEQRALIQWAKAMSGKHPQLLYLAAVPNGGHRNIIVARRMKQEGVRPGYPDLLLDCGRGGYHGLRIELKRRHGGRVSSDQQWWLDRLTALGYCARVCRGADEAREVLLWYLGLPATRTLRSQPQVGNSYSLTPENSKSNRAATPKAEQPPAAETQP